MPNLGDTTIVLASGSPRRRELLDQMGLLYESAPPDLDENAFRLSDPDDLVATLAAAKASAVRQTRAEYSHRWVLAADTVVVVDERILGKPVDRDDAGRMIALLSGRGHRVVTGIAVWPPGAQRPDVRVASTEVWFDDVSDPELRWYLDSGDWHGVAGSYRIQGHAARHITRIDGSYSNVVGLPIHLVYSILTGHGFQGFPGVA